MINKVSNYTFKNADYLQRALTHSSFSKENYERLEFLGDSILDFVVGEYLFKNSIEAEGALTKFRAQFVSEPFLSKVFDRLNLTEDVRLGRSFKANLSDSVKADIVEAIIAAVYLDGGFIKAKKFTTSVINIGNFKTMKNQDFKTQLQEFLQANRHTLKYTVLGRKGKSHNPQFEIGVLIDGELFATATASSKIKAEQKAAELAFKKLEKN